jgi:hypothetical protein
VKAYSYEGRAALRSCFHEVVLLDRAGAASPARVDALYLLGVFAGWSLAAVFELA